MEAIFAMFATFGMLLFAGVGVVIMDEAQKYFERKH